ncbi:hypothetical protein Ppa06_68120 [Planomonospora parontospora subsp. parontospora]|uniref:Secreted protein n=2 Tax=Planomonospora parontospora TaxID=58119 RepID=A0AA37BNW7_9ACTN|nr:hypothetical protein [Planomonospora parontospora]GGK99544.1 hypothetical protein GCM10010126_68940 [Planomonospora parontospora]GII13014.1 hypothetical protein Ppa06_68120 [Planomonospora parontospora subsp. parontospora]
MLVRSRPGALLPLAGLMGSLVLAGATPANAAASQIGFGLTLHVHDVDEEGTWSNGDEVFIKVVQNGSSRRYAPTDGTIDVNESDEGGMVDLRSSYPLTYEVGSRITIQVWEDDTSGDDLLAESEVTVGCNNQFGGVTPLKDRKYYHYSFDGRFHC